MILQKVNGTKLGTLVLESRGFYPGAHWYWIGVGANIGFMFLFNFLYLMCLTYLDRKLFLLWRIQYFAIVDAEIKIGQKNTAAFDKKEAVLPEEHEDAKEGGSAIPAPPRVGVCRQRSTSSTEIEAAEGNENQQRGMILPFEPHSLTFDNITYSVDMPAVREEIHVYFK